MEIKHHFGGGVYIKETHFAAGEWGEKHTHSYDHLSVLASGTAAVEVDGVVEVHIGPMVMTIQKGKSHKVMAMTDVVWLCIHATDCVDPDLIDEKLGG